tara:strand:- start:58 stop:234 length:177 start_codon:yes stop_codon:yes gene_type:complete
MSNNPYKPPKIPDNLDEDKNVSVGMWPDIIFVVVVGAIMLYGDYMVRTMARFLQGQFS